MSRLTLQLLHSFALVILLIKSGWSLKCNNCAWNVTGMADWVNADFKKECDCEKSPKTDEADCVHEVSEDPVFCISALMMVEGSKIIERFGIDKNAMPQLAENHTCSATKIGQVEPMVLCTCKDADFCNKMTDAELMEALSKLPGQGGNGSTATPSPTGGSDDGDDGSTHTRASACLMAAALVIISWTSFTAPSSLQ